MTAPKDKLVTVEDLSAALATLGAATSNGEPMLIKGIPTTADFNEITESGIYYLSDIMMQHCPAAAYSRGILEVINTTIILQRITCLNGAVVFRTKSGDPQSWQVWKESAEPVIVGDEQDA